MINFAQKGEVDGFFQRFMVSLPYEVGVPAKEKRRRMEESKSSAQSHVNIEHIISWIWEQCRVKRDLHCDQEVHDAWDIVHDEVMR